MYGVNWYPPDPRTVPCCVLMSGYRPLPEAYCCTYALPTDLELKAQSVALLARMQLQGLQEYCCCLRRRPIL